MGLHSKDMSRFSYFSFLSMPGVCWCFCCKIPLHSFLRAFIIKVCNKSARTLQWYRGKAVVAFSIDLRCFLILSQNCSLRDMISSPRKKKEKKKKKECKIQGNRGRLFVFFLYAMEKNIFGCFFIEKKQEEKRGAGSSPLGCAKIYRIDDIMLFIFLLEENCTPVRTDLLKKRYVKLIWVLLT